MNHGISWTEWEDGIVVDVSISVTKIRGISRETLEHLVSQFVKSLRAAEVCPIETEGDDNDPLYPFRRPSRWAGLDRPIDEMLREDRITRSRHRRLCGYQEGRHKHLSRPLDEQD